VAGVRCAYIANTRMLHLVVVCSGEADVAQIPGAPLGGSVGELEEGGAGEDVLLALVGEKRRGEGGGGGGSKIGGSRMVASEV
jgi:hypothetical protein